ncbi:MAG: type II toxin-antitoxin system HipA family toxin [Ignavibacteriae bacterium]|nr:MAG: type II toxin-antitoxin system HipA family toxin [Ignavibacteriota bacterium]
MAKEIKKVTAATVLLWGKEIGAVAWDAERELAAFEYTPAFLKEALEPSPLTMRKGPQIFSFPELNRKTYYGLPGMLADSLPDKFGTALINAWLARHNRPENDFSPVERLCYMGSRGMGALEYKPALGGREKNSVPIEIEDMIRLAQYVIDNRMDMLVNLGDKDKALETIIRIGTSAGGARAKALIAWNRKTREIRSGQVSPPKGFESWIMKFDGVQDRTLGVSEGYGRIEYAYHKMAVRAGIQMTECYLYEENGRAHFLTKRFDRTPEGKKIHMQSLCDIAHYDFNMAGAYGYEQVFNIILRLKLGYATLDQMYRRMVFNIVARNQDDHTKNIAFLMDKDGNWSLSPAFDLLWSYNSSGQWTNQHQMSINGKRDGFEINDLLVPAKQFGIRNANKIIREVIEAVRMWPKIAEEHGVPAATISKIAATHRLDI